MADTEGFIRITQGDSSVVGGLILNTGSTIPSGLGAGNMIFAEEVGLRVNGAQVANGNGLPTTDAGAITQLTAIAGAQGNGAAGITIPTGGLGILGWLSGIFQKLSAFLLTKPAPITLVPLDDATLTTAGTPVNVLNAGNAIAGGYIILSAAGNVNQIGTAGTTVGGSNVPAFAGSAFNIIPSANAVSVVSPTAGVTVSGYGFT